jgi:single-stranded-DNA-specific exonuclease
MEPFGPENLRPVFIVKNVADTGIGFDMAEKFHLLQQKQPVDIVFKIDENEWNGNKSLQMRAIDLRLSQ